MYSCTQRAAAAVVVCHGGTETTHPYCGVVDVILGIASEYTFDLVSALFRFVCSKFILGSYVDSQT